MTIRLRPHIATLAHVAHGSINDAELADLGVNREEILDFSVNTNPLGPPPSALNAARSVAWTHYPDDRATQLRRDLAARDQVDERAVIVANGSSEIIWLVALAFLDPGEAAVIVGPTYGEYARATRIVGGVVHDYRADPSDGFAVDLSTVVDLVHSVDGRLVFLCNPNNPTGTLLSADDIRTLSQAVPRAMVVVDEAYRPFVDDPPPTTPLLDRGNVILLRSLTKDCALAGLRLGYALAPPDICAALDNVRPPWSVNAVAQAAGLAAIGDEAHLERARAEVRQARVYLTAALSGLGFRVLPSSANYLLVEVGNAAAVRARLLEHGVCVRDCTSFGLPEYLRIGMRPIADCQQLIAAFTKIDD
jgi:histidinol-phosphate aminotransferase